MLIKKPLDLQPPEVTDYSLYRQRRRFLQGSVAFFGGLLVPCMYSSKVMAKGAGKKLSDIKKTSYGEALPNQNGAPLRLAVPWKYGFKNIKSIVKIRFTEALPKITWELSAPSEYGFYANVNPEVSHPHRSQAEERRIGSGSIFSQ